MKDKVKEIILSLGADVCGVANINRFTHTPKGFSPTDVFTDCKSVIVFGIALPKGLMQVDAVSFNAAKNIEKEFGCFAVPVPCDGPYDFWDEENMEGRGLISMKHAAVKAGLGTLGISTLLINNKFWVIYFYHKGRNRRGKRL